MTPFLKFMTNQRSFESCFFQWHLWLPSMICVKKPRSVLHYFSSLIGLTKFLLKSGGKLDFSGIKRILISAFVPESCDIFHNLLVINKLLVHALLKDEWKKTKFKVYIQTCININSVFTSVNCCLISLSGLMSSAFSVSQFYWYTVFKP